MKISRKGANGKGTVWYFSDIVVAVTSLVGTLFMMFIAALILFVLSSRLDVSVVGLMLYATPKADNTLMTYMDTTAGGYTMNDLLSYAVLADNDTFMLDGKSIDIKPISAEIMGKITTRPYTLRLQVGDKSMVLASVGKAEAVENIVTQTVVQGGENEGKLTLTVVR
jgi:hypothetical protein